MSLSASTVWEVRTTGSDNNGGGFVSGGTDYSQQNAAQLSLTDLACVTGGSTLTSATGGFTAAMVGNLIHITAGTSFTTGFYQITAHTDTNTVTLDRDPTDGSNASGGTGAVGGALATPKAAIDAMVSGNTVWIKSGTYTIGTAISRSGGAVSGWAIRGYDATRGDGGRPVLQASAAIVTLTMPDDGSSVIDSLDFDGNDTGTTGLYISNWSGGTRTWAINSIFRRQTTIGASSDFGVLSGFFRCTFDDNGDGVFCSTARLIYCVAKNNTGNGFYRSTGVLVSCVAHGNGGLGFELYGGGTCILSNCVAFSNTGDGFGGGDFSSRSAYFDGCIAYGNGGYGIGNGTFPTTTFAYITNCAVGSNTSGGIQGTITGIISGTITLTADPFEDGANGDFNLNEDSGGGALLRDVTFNLAGATSTAVYPYRQWDVPGGGGSNVPITWLLGP